MTGRELICRLHKLKESLPDAEAIDPYSSELLSQLGEAEVLVGMYNKMDAIEINSNIKFLSNYPTHCYLLILKTISKTLYELEIKYPKQDTKQVYASGDAYEFYHDFKAVVLAAKQSILIIDPYINNELFDLYIEKLPDAIECHVLLNKVNDTIRILIDKLKLSPSRRIEVKSSTEIHDRVVFIDKRQCWILGQSIKDAAMKKPTYFLQLPDDLAIDKLKYYEQIWINAKSI